MHVWSNCACADQIAHVVSVIRMRGIYYRLCMRRQYCARADQNMHIMTRLRMRLPGYVILWRLHFSNSFHLVIPLRLQNYCNFERDQQHWSALTLYWRCSTTQRLVKVDATIILLITTRKPIDCFLRDCEVMKMSKKKIISLSNFAKLLGTCIV